MTQMIFLNGYIMLNVSLSTRRYQMIRKLNLGGARNEIGRRIEGEYRRNYNTSQ